MALSDALMKHDKPKSKAYTLKNIEGLALFVSPSGGKTCHFRFTLQGNGNVFRWRCIQKLALHRQKCSVSIIVLFHMFL